MTDKRKNEQPTTDEQAKEFADAWNLTETLSDEILSRFNSKQLNFIRRILVDRAARIISETVQLEAAFRGDKFAVEQFSRMMFNFKLESATGYKFFEYSCEPRFESNNFFTPGDWFIPHLEKLDELRSKTADAETIEKTKCKNLSGLLINGIAPKDS